MRNQRRKQVADNRKKRKLVVLTLGIVGVLYLTYNLVVGDSGLLKYIELRTKKEKLLAETNTLKKQNDEIENEINSLEKSPENLEGRAREHGLAKEGELIFKFEDNK